MSSFNWNLSILEGLGQNERPRDSRRFSPSESLTLERLTTVLSMVISLVVFSVSWWILFFRRRCLFFVGLPSREILLIFRFSCVAAILCVFLLILSNSPAKLASIISSLVSSWLILLVSMEIASWWYFRRCFIRIWEVLFKELSHFLRNVCSRHFTWGTKGMVEILRPFGTKLFPKHVLIKDKCDVCLDL